MNEIRYVITKVSGSEFKASAFKQEDLRSFFLWLAKFWRHIDNVDKSLTDDENFEFLRKKIKDQFDIDILEVMTWK